MTFLWFGAKRGNPAMFMGEYHPTMDEKSRIAVPMRLRKAFGDDALITRLVLTHGFDKCIMAYREQEWQDFVQNKLMTLPQGDSGNRMRLRFLLGGATECDLDKQGRIIIPAYLQKYAELDSDVTMLGLYDRVEIWSSKVYSAYKPDGEALNNFAKELGF